MKFYDVPTLESGNSSSANDSSDDASLPELLIPDEDSQSDSGSDASSLPELIDQDDDSVDSSIPELLHRNHNHFDPKDVCYQEAFLANRPPENAPPLAPSCKMLPPPTGIVKTKTNRSIRFGENQTILIPTIPQEPNVSETE